MKILIVVGGFFPGRKYGGPPVSVDNFCSLMKDHDCYIITVNHDLFETAPYKSIHNGWNNRGNSRVLYLSDEEYKKGTFEKVINEIKPDLLYLQGIFQSCILPCLQLAKKYGIRVLLAPRGELCEGAFNMKRYKKVPYVKFIRIVGLVKNIHWQSTSDEETDAIKKLMKVTDDHVHRLDNIPSIPKCVYPRKGKVSGKGHFVFLSRIHPKKNLLFAISLFKEIDGKVEFDIYGPIEDGYYWKQCQKEIEKLPERVKVKYEGLINHDQVHEIFSKYDAFLFPTLSENYGHVIAECLMVGTPVIISDQTPWRGLEEAGLGWDISLDNENRFQKAIQKVVDSDKNQAIEQSRVILQFSKNKMKIDELKDSYNFVLTKI